MKTPRTAHAFARLAGVTAKTLRHYERRQLTPRRNASGYRLYSDRELRRVREIVSLKALGLSLTQIRDLLDKRGAPLDVLRGQRESLESKRRSLDRAIDVIREVQHAASRGSGSATLSTLLAEAVWSHAEQKRERSGPGVRPPDRAGASRIALAHEILRAIERGDEGETERAKWHALIAKEAADDPEVAAATAKAWANRRHWPRGMREWVASLYDMDVASFEKLARFIESRWGSAPHPGSSLAGAPRPAPLRRRRARR